MPEPCPYDVNTVIAVMKAKGYKVFANRKGHDLNLVGIRTDDQTANSFNDWFTLFYRQVV